MLVTGTDIDIAKAPLSDAMQAGNGVVYFSRLVINHSSGDIIISTLHTFPNGFPLSLCAAELHSQTNRQTSKKKNINPFNS